MNIKLESRRLSALSGMPDFIYLFIYSVSQSASQSVSQLVSKSVSLSVDQTAIVSFIYWLVWFIYWLMYLFTHPFIYSFIHPFIQSIHQSVNQITIHPFIYTENKRYHGIDGRIVTGDPVNLASTEVIGQAQTGLNSKVKAHGMSRCRFLFVTSIA